MFAKLNISEMGNKFSVTQSSDCTLFQDVASILRLVNHTCKSEYIFFVDTLDEVNAVRHLMIQLFVNILAASALDEVNAVKYLMIQLFVNILAASAHIVCALFVDTYHIHIYIDLVKWLRLVTFLKKWQSNFSILMCKKLIIY